MNEPYSICHTNKIGRLLTGDTKFCKLMKYKDGDLEWQYIINILAKDDTGYEFTDKKCKVKLKYRDRKIWCYVTCKKIDDGFCYMFKSV